MKNFNLPLGKILNQNGEKSSSIHLSLKDHFSNLMMYIEKQFTLPIILLFIFLNFTPFIVATRVILLGPADACAVDKSTVEIAPNPQSIKLNEAGVAQIKAKNFLAAEDSFKKSLAADRSNLTAVYNLAGVYLQNKRVNAAIDLLSAYSRETQNDAGIFSRLGDAYFAAKQVIKQFKASKKYTLLIQTTHSSSQS